MKLRSRRGFTLIELLVVMTLITTLAGLALLIIPSINTNRRAADAADRLQQWLLIARQRALRDQAPRGVRLILDPADATGNTVRELQFIETPDNFAPGNGITLFVRQMASSPLPTSNPGYQPLPRTVQISSDITSFIREGDLLEITSVTNTQSGIYRIAGPNTWPWFTPAPAFPIPGPGTQFEVTSEIKEAKDADLVLSSNYRFIRQPKPLVGEEPLKLPDGVVIDLRTYPLGVMPTKGVRPPLDILFAPSGAVVVGNGYIDNGTFKTVSANGKIVLHVRDEEGAGASTLMTIYTRNGLIAAHPPNTNPAIDGGDFYGNTTDGKSSGL